MTQYTCKTIGTKCRECRGACLDKTNPSQTQKMQGKCLGLHQTAAYQMKMVQADVHTL